MMKYTLFFTGVASTPHSVGLVCTTTGEIINEIITSRPSGKETRKVYQEKVGILKKKYSSLLN